MPPKGSKRKKATAETIEEKLEVPSPPTKRGRVGVKQEQVNESEISVENAVKMEERELVSNTEGTIEAKTNTEVRVKADPDEELSLNDKGDENTQRKNGVPSPVSFSFT